jgi:hypothetical protein
VYYRTHDDGGGPSLRSVTPYRAAKLAARRSRPGRKPESPPIPVTAEALGRHHKAEIEKWWPIIKAANIKVETDK